MEKGRLVPGHGVRRWAGSVFVAEFSRSFVAARDGRIAHRKHPVSGADFIKGDIKTDLLSGLPEVRQRVSDMQQKRTS